MTILPVSTAVLLSVAAAVSQQKPLTPSSPATDRPPQWSRALKMPDGRTFVTDGGLAIDAAVAKPAKLPETALGPANAAVIVRYFSAPYDDDVELSDLGVGPFKNTLATRKGIVLNGNYVKYLRGILPARNVRLHVKGGLDPIVVLLDGKPIAVLMPVRH
jgi:hypothetical protein